MAKRQSVKKIPTDDLQGKGSFVIVSAVKVREIKETRAKSAAHTAAIAAGEESDFNEFEAGLEMMTKHIVGWDWVDDKGNPLAQPKDDPSVVDELTNEESEFIVGILMGAESKN